MVEKDYTENIKKLTNEFTRIRNLGWVKGVSNGTGNAGDTFEFYLGKERENFPIADFDGIEIKTRTTENDRIPINLFTAIPYGEEFFEIKRILDRYGIEDKNKPGIKKLNGSVYGNFYKSIYYNNFKFKLKLNMNEKKIELQVYDEKTKAIENSTYWPFEVIEKKIANKLKYVALVKVKKKVVNNETLFLYENMTIYEFKGIDVFWQLIAKGVVFICFSIGGYGNEKYSHLIHDHGTAFRIKKHNLNKLFFEVGKV